MKLIVFQVFFQTLRCQEERRHCLLSLMPNAQIITIIKQSLAIDYQSKLQVAEEMIRSVVRKLVLISSHLYNNI